jgi:butyrate kinase
MTIIQTLGPYSVKVNKKLGDASKICDYINGVQPNNRIIISHVAKIAGITEISAKNILHTLSNHLLITTSANHRTRRYFRKENKVTIKQVKEAQSYRIF